MNTAPFCRAGTGFLYRNCLAGLWLFLFALISPLPAGETSEVFGFGSEWSYWDEGTRPPLVDRFEFDASAWPAGPGPLGYGDEGMNTVVGFGEDHDNKPITTYFHKRFEVADGLSSRTLVVRYQRDDGIRLFLNGVEVLRENLPEGRIVATTLATRSLGGEESEVVEVEIDTPLLREGENVMMAEVHQASPGSADLRFDLALSVVESPRNYEGAGTAEDPFRIETLEQFVRIGQRPADWDNHFLLTGYFSLREVENYRPIGSGHGRASFSGVFDGGGITLQQFTYEGEENGPVGLFGVVTGTIKNMRLYGFNIGGEGRDFVGALVGQCEGRLENCQAVNVVARGRSYVGGLAGLVRHAERCSARSVDVSGGGGGVGGLAGVANVVRESWSSGQVSGGNYTGGLVGTALEAVHQSFSQANVHAGEGPAGGLAGHLNDFPQMVQDCYATGTVVVEDDGGAGGLVGFSSESSVVRSYASGRVEAPAAAGGLIGRQVSPWGENLALFWDRERSGMEVAIGAGGGDDEDGQLVGLSSDAMQSAAAFLEAGWNFEGEEGNGEAGIWKMVEYGAPRLWWEEEPGVDPVGTRTNLVAWGSEWRYWDRGVPPEGWHLPFFHDLDWERGRAELGYGDGDEVTTVGFGEDAENKHVTTYFRREFLFITGKLPRGIVLEVKRDDGVRVFLNGEEVLRDNLPSGEIGHETLATAVAEGDGNRLIEVMLPPTLLTGGHNVFSAEVHQATPASSDLSFDLRLSALIDSPDYPGSGTADDPFRLSSAAQLMQFSKSPHHWGGHALMTDDIDLTGFNLDELLPIGDRRESAFTGVFDGGGHTIRGYRNIPDNDGDEGRLILGLFGQNDGTICNLTMSGFDVGSPWDEVVGALAQYSTGWIKNCHAIGGRVVGLGTAGGLVGDAYLLEDCSAVDVAVDIRRRNAGVLAGVAAQVSRCWSSGEVVGDTHVGGLVGFIISELAYSFSTAESVARTGSVGGLVGAGNDRPNLVHHCYAWGGVRSDEESGMAGGLIGYLSESSISECFAAVEVSGHGALGGLVGALDATWGENLASFWDVEASGQVNAVGQVDDPDDVAALRGLGQAASITATPFLAAGWDYWRETENGDDDLWKYVRGGYPRLFWEDVEADDPNASEEIDVIAAGSVWRYSDVGWAPNGWAGLEFDDGEWPSGRAQLGYGEGDEATVVGWGDDPNNRHVTTYFRKVFEVAEGRVPTNLKLGVVRDDGVAVYLNGEEVVRDNLPAGTIWEMTLAVAPVGGPEEDAFIEFGLPDSMLRPGENVLAVEVHQVGRSSADMSFDLWLRGSVAGAPGAPYPGTGTERDPFRIATAAHLRQMVEREQDWGRHFVQVADIDLGEGGPRFPGIGWPRDNELSEKAFTGSFDGGGFEIRNLRMDSEAPLKGVGMFGLISGASLRDIHLVDGSAMAPRAVLVGMLVGQARGSEIAGCSVRGGGVRGAEIAGGMTGSLWDGSTMVDCHADVEASVVDDDAGGLAGQSDGEMRRCSARGNVRGGGGLIGGLVGSNNGLVVQCVASGDVESGGGYAGGLIGRQFEVAPGMVDSYATGAVSGGIAAGLIGGNRASSARFGFATGAVSSDGIAGGAIGDEAGEAVPGNAGIVWNVETTGQATSAGDVNSEGGWTSAEMASAEMWIEEGYDLAGEAGNGDADVWVLERPGGLRLWWESPGDDGDRDGDGLDDAWERETFGDLAQDAEGDFDGDGLSNGREFELGLDAAGADSDGDGFGDGLEVAFGSDPLDAEDTPRRLGEKLLAGDGGEGDLLGTDVAISGDTVVLGAPGERAAYVFRRVWHRWRDGGPRWEQVARLDDGTDALVAANTGFGTSVAVHGRWVAVGAPGLDTVFLYRRVEGGEFRHAAQLSIWDDPATAVMDFAPGAMAFGADVAMHDGVLVVGSPSFLGTGMAYVYERREAEWQYGGRLMPALDPIAFRPAGEYGQAVAVHGRRAAVLTPIGARVSVFEKREGRWADVGELWVEGVEFPAGVRGDVAIYRGRVAAVGVGDPGKVYLWRRGEGGGWQREAPVETPAVQLDSVGLWGPTLVAGASGDRSFGVQSGAVYVYKRGRWGREGWSWDLDQTLFPRDAMAEKDFGFAVALSRNHTLVGAPRDGENGVRAGAGYVFGQQRFRWFRDWVWRHQREGAGGAGGDGRDALTFALGDDVFGWSDDEAAPSLVAGAGESDGVPCLTFTFTMPDPVPLDVEYEVQVASRLDGDWEKIAVRGVDGAWDGEATVNEHMAEDGRVCVVVHDVLPLGSEAERFVRLVVRVADGEGE